MKRMFIDDIKKRGDKSLPGPGKYEMKKLFGQSGLTYSMGSKMALDKQALGRSAKLPGPGFYVHQEVVGKDIPQSKYKTESKFSFGKAKDRFNVPTRKIPAPAPDAYQPLNNLN